VVAGSLKQQRRGPARASLPSIPDWMNRALIALQRAEGKVVWKWGFNLPWGSSVVSVGRKPE